MAYTKHIWTTNKETSAKFTDAVANEMEQGIYDAHLIATPVDNTSRVFEITGDGLSGAGVAVKDRSGIQTALSNTGVTPVNGKFCKELSFNGTTSFLQASSPVIGTTGTIAVRFKRVDLARTQFLFDNRNATSADVGIGAFLDTSNALQISIRASGVTPNYQIAVIGDTSIYHTVILIISSSTLISYVDGIYGTQSLGVPMGTSVTNLSLGRATSNVQFFNGNISHFRYDSRIWTADEARAWYLNPVSVDSRIA